MAGTQTPKGFGILFALVGIPLIIWSAMGTREELDALNASSSTSDARVEQCLAKTAEWVPDTSIRRPVCECVVAKATKRGAVTDYGGYDEERLGPIVDECMRGDWG